MSYSEKTSQFIFWCLPKFNSLNCFANTGFLFTKITSQASRRINSLKIKDKTEFSVKQNHAWNHNEKLGARGCVSYFISFKNFHKPLSLGPTFLPDLHGVFPQFGLRTTSFMPTSINQGVLSHTLDEGGGQPEELRGDRLFPRWAGMWQPRSHPWVMPGGTLGSAGAEAASAWSCLVWVKPKLKQSRFPVASLAKEGRRRLPGDWLWCTACKYIDTYGVYRYVGWYLVI